MARLSRGFYNTAGGGPPGPPGPPGPAGNLVLGILANIDLKTGGPVIAPSFTTVAVTIITGIFIRGNLINACTKLPKISLGLSNPNDIIDITAISGGMLNSNYGQYTTNDWQVSRNFLGIGSNPLINVQTGAVTVNPNDPFTVDVYVLGFIL